MTIEFSKTRASSRASLVCAALAGITVMLGAWAPPSSARPDIGVGSSQRTADVATEVGGATAAPGQRYVLGPTLLAGSMGVHVDGGWLLQ